MLTVLPSPSARSRISLSQEKKYKTVIQAPSTVSCVAARGSPPCKASWPSPPSPPKLSGSLLGMVPGFKSQGQPSSVAPFPTPPTINYTCQHSCILPALLGCHSKSGQVWPHGMEPIFSKLSWRLCNQGELLPSYIFRGSHSHLPGSKQGHSYLKYLRSQLKVIDMLNDLARG